MRIRMVLQLLLVLETLGAYITFEALALLQVRILMHFELLLGLEYFVACETREWFTFDFVYNTFELRFLR